MSFFPFQNTDDSHPFTVQPLSQNQSLPASSYPVVDTAVTITSQPGAKIGDLNDNSVRNSNAIAAGNSGLDYLRLVDQLVVKQKIELLEVYCGCETRNRYTIKNSMGQKAYTAVEDTDCCTRNTCGTIRPFDLQILDHRQKEVIHLYRELRCQDCCCPCCLQLMEVCSPPGNVLGTIQQEWSILIPNLTVQTACGETLFTIEGPLCTCSCCCDDVDFPICNAKNGKKIGNITKQWSGCIRESLTDADHFGITFPMDLDVNHKAMLLGALFLIDFMYFEKK